MFKRLTETKTVDIEVNQSAILELAKTKKIATISETDQYVSKNGGYLWSGTWIDLDGENAVAYHLNSPKKKIKLKLALKDGYCDIPKLGLKNVYLWRLQKYSGLLTRNDLFDYRRDVAAGRSPDLRLGVLVE